MGAHLILRNTKRSGSTRPTSMRQSTLIKTRPVLLLLWIFFRLLWRLPTARQTVGFAHPYTRQCKHELGSLGVGSPRPLFEVLGEQLLCLLVEFGTLPGAFLGSKVPRSSSWLQ